MIPNEATANSMAIYNEAKSCLGKHITLNQDVPAEVGCAEAVSFVLARSGFILPTSGIASTTDLHSWLKSNNKFTEVTTPIVGDIIISPTGMSSKDVFLHGHTGIVANYGILSNDSQSGLFLELWTIEKWIQNYQCILGFPVFYFRAV